MTLRQAVRWAAVAGYVAAATALLRVVAELRRIPELSIADLSPFLVLAALAATVAVTAACNTKYWTVPGILAGALAAWTIGSWPQALHGMVHNLTMLLTRHVPPNTIIEPGYWTVAYGSFAEFFLVIAATELVIAQGARARGRLQLSPAKRVA